MPLRRPLRLVALATAFFLAASTRVHAGDLNQEIDTLFNSLGGSINATSPQAIQGQRMNTYVGGGIYYRAPSRSFQVVNLSLPSIKAGCGGINAWMGSFSHISGDELRDMLAAIGTDLAGVAFNAALKSISPLLGGIVENFQAIAAKYNNGRISSCEAATAIAGTVSDQMGWSVESTCQYLAGYLNSADDVARARERCATASRADVMNQARASTDPQINAAPPFEGNLTWRALKAIPTLDDEARMIAMSIVGTTVYGATGTTRGIQSYEPTIRQVEHLLYGDTGDPSGTVGIPVYRCDDNDECMNPVVQLQSVANPLNKRVEDILNDVVDKIRTRTAIAQNHPANALVNTTSIPVWRMVSVGTAVNDPLTPASNLAGMLVAKYKDIVAADFAITFLDQFSGYGLAGLANNFKLNNVQLDRVRELREGVMNMKFRLTQERTRLSAVVAADHSFIGYMESLERSLRMNMPAYVQEMMRSPVAWK